MAYYTTSIGQLQLEHCLLRARLLDILPPYMIPALFVRVDTMPVTMAGRLDKRALPMPEITQDKRNIYASKPMGYLEKGLVSLIKNIFKQHFVNASDHLIQMGGDSFVFAQLASSIGQLFGVQLTIHDIFMHPTVAELIDLIKERRFSCHDENFNDFIASHSHLSRGVDYKNLQFKPAEEQTYMLEAMPGRSRICSGVTYVSFPLVKFLMRSISGVFCENSHNRYNYIYKSHRWKMFYNKSVSKYKIIDLRGMGKDRQAEEINGYILRMNRCDYDIASD